MTKKKLLELKKRLLALALATACTFGLAGCGKGQESSSGSAEVSNENMTQTDQKAIVILYEDRAVVIYCNQVVINNSARVYCLNPYLVGEDGISLYKTTKYTDIIPITDNTYVCTPEVSITPEEYVATIKGSDFPITYLSTSSETLEEEGPKLTK